MSTDDTPDVPTEPFVHWCESCGREELLDSSEAYKAGWDFPPHMGTWGVVSPRTCPNCSIEKTVWWEMAAKKRSIDELTARELKVIGRILEELPPGTRAPADSSDDDGDSEN